MSRIIAITLIAILGYGGRCLDAVAADAPPAAPTLQDAHQFFESLVAKNGVAALYTASRDGEFLGYVSFPVRRYGGRVCNSKITLASGVKIDFDWTVVNQSQLSDAQIGLWRSPNVIYELFHMITIEGGIVAEPSNYFPKLILAINDEISRNRLLKAINLLASTCRSKTKFD